MRTVGRFVHSLFWFGVVANSHLSWAASNYASLSRTDRKELIRQIAHDEETFFESGDIVRAEKDAEILCVDLNKDGVQEVLVNLQVQCGASGNCPNFVYARTRNGFRQLLSTTGYGLEVLETRSMGYHNLAIPAHVSAEETLISHYRYERGTYHLQECLLHKVAGSEESTVQVDCPK